MYRDQFGEFLCILGLKGLTLSLPNAWPKANFDQSSKFHFLKFILRNKKLMTSCEITGRELSFEWSHHRISSIDSKVRVTLQNPIKHSGSESVK